MARCKKRSLLKTQAIVRGTRANERADLHGRKRRGSLEKGESLCRLYNVLGGDVERTKAKGVSSRNSSGRWFGWTSLSFLFEVVFG